MVTVREGRSGAVGGVSEDGKETGANGLTKEASAPVSPTEEDLALVRSALADATGNETVRFDAFARREAQALALLLCVGAGTVAAGAEAIAEQIEQVRAAIGVVYPEEIDREQLVEHLVGHVLLDAFGSETTEKGLVGMLEDFTR